MAGRGRGGAREDSAMRKRSRVPWKRPSPVRRAERVLDPFEFERRREPKVVTRSSASWVVEEGNIEIKTRASAGAIRALRADEGIANFNPPEEEKELLAGIATGMNANVTVAIHDGSLVGYAVVEKPDPRIRWGQSEIESLYELEVVEVSRNHRKQGLGRKMLELIFSDPSMERLIVVATEYVWHWDLVGSGLDKDAYRRMMRGLFSSVGFEVTQTDEPNISAEPENLLMVRRGSRVSRKVWLTFESLLETPEERRLVGPVARGRHKQFRREG